MVIGVDGIYNTFECAAIRNGKCYFVDYHTSTLNVYNLIKHKIISRVRLYDNDMIRSFSSIIIHKDCVYLFPFYAKEVIKYNITSEKLYRIPLNLPNELSCGGGYFFDAYVYEDCIYALGSSLPAILMLNTNNDQIDYIYGFVADLEKYIIHADESCFFCKGYMDNARIYAPYCKGNALFIFDIKTGKYSIVEIVGVKDGFSSIIRFNNKKYLLSRTKGVFYSLTEKDVLIKKHTLNEERAYNTCWCINFIIYNKQLYALGYSDVINYKYNPMCDSFEEINELNCGGMANSSENGDDIMVFSLATGMVVLLCEEHAEETFRIKNDDMRIIATGLIREENTCDNLQSLIRMLISENQ